MEGTHKTRDENRNFQQIFSKILYGREIILPIMNRADFHRPVLDLEAGSPL